MNNTTPNNIKHADGWARSLFQLLAVGLLGFGLASTANAGPREQAKRIHDRLAGVPPSATVLQSMQDDIVGGGGPIAAAFTAMDNPSFYNVTLKNFAAPWTNRAQSVFVPLNDYIATVVGLVRDDDTIGFDQILYGDVIYVGNAGLGLPPYSNNNNNHYEEMENRGLDMQAGLEQRAQSSVTGLPPERNCRRHDDASRCRSVLRRRHQPRDVPLHVAQSHVQRHGADARHQVGARSHPPGCQP